MNYLIPAQTSKLPDISTTIDQPNIVYISTTIDQTKLLDISTTTDQALGPNFVIAQLQ